MNPILQNLFLFAAGLMAAGWACLPLHAATANAAPQFSQGNRITLVFINTGEGFVHEYPLRAEDPDGDTPLRWELAPEGRVRVDVSLGAAQGQANTLLITFPRDGFHEMYRGTLTIEDSRGGRLELPVRIDVFPPSPTQIPRDEQGSLHSTFPRSLSLMEDEPLSPHLIYGHDPDFNPTRLNHQTPYWRIANTPALGTATITPQAYERGSEVSAVLNYAPFPDAYGQDTIIVEAAGDEREDGVQQEFHVTIKPVNDAPRLKTRPKIEESSLAANALAHANPGEWTDPESDLANLQFDFQWLINDQATFEGALELDGATQAVFAIQDELAGKYLGFRVTASDLLIKGHEGKAESAAAYSEFVRVEAGPPWPDFSELPAISIRGGYRIRELGEPMGYGDGWIQEGQSMINVRRPELSFNLAELLANAGVAGAIRGFDENPSLLAAGSGSGDIFFRVQEVLDPSSRPLGAAFSSATRGATLVPVGTNDFYSLSADRFRTQARHLNGSEHGSSTGDDRVGIPSRISPDGTAGLVLGPGNITAVEFPGLEPRAQAIIERTGISTREDWGLNPNGTRALINISAPEEAWLLLDTESGAVVKKLDADFQRDRVVFPWKNEKLLRNPTTVTVQGQECFLLARSFGENGLAALEYRSWETGGLAQSALVEDGWFHFGDYYHPSRPDQFVYPSLQSSTLLVLDLATGALVERLIPPIPQERQHEVARLAEIKVSFDGGLLFYEEYHEAPSPNTSPVYPPILHAPAVAAFHPLATGELQGLVFEDSNGNGKLDLGLIESEEPHIIYVIDVSGSTEEVFQGNSVGDVNRDAKAGTILDAELAAFIDFHQNLIRFGLGDRTRVGVVPFGDRAVAYGYDGRQYGEVSDARGLVGAQEDADGNLIPDVIDSLRSIRNGAAGVGPGTQYLPALQQAQSLFAQAGTQPEQANIIFLSDGEPNNGNFASIARELQSLGVNVRAIGVGGDSRLDPLRQMDAKAIQVQSSDELIAAFRPKEKLLEDITVYLDLDENGKRDAGEPKMKTARDNPFTSGLESGAYVFAGLAPEKVTIRVDDRVLEQTLAPTAVVAPVVPTTHLIAVRVLEAPSLPIIAVHPQGGEVNEGEPFTFAVTATGLVLGYQWVKDGLSILGETNPFLVLSSVTEANAGVYQVMVQGEGGAVKSDTARLSVRGEPPPALAIDAPSLGFLEAGGRRNLVLTIQPDPGKSYQVVMKTDLASEIWTPVGPQQTAGDDALTFLIDVTGQAAGYFRVVDIGR